MHKFKKIIPTEKTYHIDYEREKMKETIYTIPINEVYDTDCECPLCELESRLETEACDYALGAAMMEPDYRIESNSKGYCSRHFSMLFSNTNKLSLALILDTHLNELRAGIENFSKEASSLKNSGKNLFKKGNASAFSEKLCNYLEKKENSCIVCDKISRTMTRYVDILLEMWESEPDFRAKFEQSKGVCLHHFSVLAKTAAKKLSSAKAAEFLSYLTKKEIEELERIQKDIHKFTLKFDYRNSEMDWGTAKDAPIRTIEKIAGTILKND